MQIQESFPSIEPFDHGWLKTSDNRHIYYEQCGNPEGKPILYIPGGPGQGSSPKDRRLVDPEKWRFILIDPRGCGRSRPIGEDGLKENDIPHIAGDINLILKRLGIEKITLFGWSFGSTVALFYGINYPELVSAIIIGGVCLGEKEDLAYLSDGRMSEVVPREWRIFYSGGDQYNNGVAHYYHHQITSPQEFRSSYYARIWTAFHVAILGLDESKIKAGFLNSAMVQSYYFANKFFLDEGYIINNVSAIKVPVVIIHGTKDVLRPIANVRRLQGVLPQSCLFETEGGHRKTDENNLPHLLLALDMLHNAV